MVERLSGWTARQAGSGWVISRRPVEAVLQPAVAVRANAGPGQICVGTGLGNRLGQLEPYRVFYQGT